MDQTWDKGDSIGISSTFGGEIEPFVNLKYITENGNGEFTGASPLFYYRAMTLVAYYPFTGKEGVAPGIVKASTSVENQAPAMQPKLDFLWDSKTSVDLKDFSATNREVKFTFAHKMSKVTFTFQSSPPVYDKDGRKIADSVDVSTMVSYELQGMVMDGTFDPATGVCAVEEGASATPITIDVTNSVEHNKALRSLIFFPQTLSADGVQLHIATDELNLGNPETYQYYTCRLMFSNGVINPGLHYKYTIKVTKLGLIVGNMTVEPWKEEERSMIATIDGEQEFKEQ